MAKTETLAHLAATSAGKGCIVDGHVIEMDGLYFGILNPIDAEESEVLVQTCCQQELSIRVKFH